MIEYHEDVCCGGCGGPLECHRDAVCETCVPEAVYFETCAVIQDALAELRGDGAARSTDGAAS